MPGWKRSRSVLPSASRPSEPFSPSGTSATEPMLVRVGAEQQLALRVPHLAATGLAAGEQRFEGLQARIVRAHGAHEVLRRARRLRRRADQQQRGIEGVEVFAQARFDLRRAPARASRARSRRRVKRCSLSARASLARATRTNSASFCSSAGLLLAQHFDLALDQRDGGAGARVRQAQPREQRLVPLEEIRIVLQITGDGLFFRSPPAARPRASRVVIYSCSRVSCRSPCSMHLQLDAPSNDTSAGPVSQMCSPGPGQFTRNSPPRTRTWTSASSLPCRRPTATAAQAPVPHASVSPVPRS